MLLQKRWAGPPLSGLCKKANAYCISGGFLSVGCVAALALELVLDPLSAGRAAPDTAPPLWLAGCIETTM